MAENYINHIAIVLDASSSMHHIAEQTIQVADEQIKYLALRSQEKDQETRATIYTFADDVKCVFYDKDVLRLPSVRGVYSPFGNTALVDATIRAIRDLKQTATLYGDHAFLLYVITDGQENRSRRFDGYDLNAEIKGLPSNWTVAALVPGAGGVDQAKRFGFPEGNIQIWETSESGMKAVGETIRRTTDAYMTARTHGMRSTNSLFSLGDQNLVPSVVNVALDKLDPLQYDVLSVPDTVPIKDFVVSRTGKPYKIGSGFYQLTKTEEIQAQKQIAVRDLRTGEFFSGSNARQLLGLPDYSVRVQPGDYRNYEIFVQSTSVNRKLLPGTKLLVVN